MKRKHWAMLWAAAVVPMLWFHNTRGQMLLRRDAIATALRAGHAAESKADFTAAADRYRAAQDAIGQAGVDPGVNLFCQVDILRAQSHDRPVPDQIKSWDTLLKDNVATASARPEDLNDIRIELARLHFESASLMARSGMPRTLWRDEAELARQQFGYVARTESNPARISAAASNLESVYRLEHTDDATLISRSLRPKDESAAKPIMKAKRSADDSEANSDKDVLGSGSSAGGNSNPSPQGGAAQTRRKGS